MEHPIELTAESLWDDVAARLRGALNETTFQTWFGEVDAVLELDDDAFVLAVPNDFTREWIEGHFLELIRAAVKDATRHRAARAAARRPRRRPPAPPAAAASRLAVDAAAARAAGAPRAATPPASTRSTPSTRS